MRVTRLANDQKDHVDSQEETPDHVATAGFLFIDVLCKDNIHDENRSEQWCYEQGRHIHCTHVPKETSEREYNHPSYFQLTVASLLRPLRHARTARDAHRAS